MKLKITVAAFLLCCATNIFAQTTGEHCVAFKAKVDSSVGVTLTESQETALISKVNQILTRNNASTTSLYNGFAMTPQIIIVSEESMTTGIRPVTSVVSEVTFLASNIVDESNYGSITIEVKVTGNSQEDAITKIIAAIRPADPRITKFVNSAVSRITDYYTMNMPTIIQKTETLMSGGKYEEAMIFLESIPTCVPAYEQSSKAIQDLYKVISDKSCTLAVGMANRYIAIEDYESAKEILLGVAAGSDCDDEITALLNKVNKGSKGGDIEVDDEPLSEPEAEVEEEALPETTNKKLNDPFPAFEMEVISCEGNSSTNVVSIVILVKNVTDLEQSFSGARHGTMAYNDSGDEFSLSGSSNNVITLRPEMSRKMSITFSRVSAKNSTINVALQCQDTKSGKGGVIDIKNLPVVW